MRRFRISAKTPNRCGTGCRSRCDPGAGIHSRAQYRFVFEWLTDHFDKKGWIERSGASLLFVPVLDRIFPGARFVHVFRDGRDTAISMHRHHFFRLRIQAAELLKRIGFDPFHPFNWLGTSPWMPLFERWRFRFFSAERYRRMRIRLDSAGWFWSGMIERGSRYLAALPEDRVLSMRFEDVVESPRTEMSRFIEFVGTEFGDRRWLEKVRQMPRGRPPSWHRLTPGERRSLAAACAPGQAILGYDTDLA